MPVISPPDWDGAIVKADALTFLRGIPDATASLCFTSPPYWAKRTYAGDPHELGQERTPWQYIARLLIVCGELRRVLTPTGWLILNLADTYSGQPGRGRGGATRAISPSAQLASASAPDHRRLDRPRKSLTGIPWRLADALTQEGWYWRNTIAWIKTGHQPENVNDRLTQAWEPLLCLANGPHSEYNHPRTHGQANDTDVWRIPAGPGLFH